MIPLKNIAIIPARAGSKGLPGKNTRLLCGKPLITWTIEAAKASHQLDHIFVSTDSDAIADIALSVGAELPGGALRPGELAQDDTAGIRVVRHVIEQYGEPCNVLLLQPTSPLRTTTQINEALALFLREADSNMSVVSMTESKPLAWQGAIDERGLWQRFDLQDTASNRQYAHVHYVLNGAIYIATSQKLIQSDFLTAPVRPYVMLPETSVDIDTLSDFYTAEALLQLQINAGVL